MGIIPIPRPSPALFVFVDEWPYCCCCCCFPSRYDNELYCFWCRDDAILPGGSPPMPPLTSEYGVSSGGSMPIFDILLSLCGADATLKSCAESIWFGVKGVTIVQKNNSKNVVYCLQQDAGIITLIVSRLYILAQYCRIQTCTVFLPHLHYPPFCELGLANLLQRLWEGWVHFCRVAVSLPEDYFGIQDWRNGLGALVQVNVVHDNKKNNAETNASCNM